MNNTTKDIDDVDDELFISKRPHYIFDKKANDIEERTSKMMQNTKSLVQESEMIGQSTLENLSSQRETLERVENDLDSINSMTRSTQKHLNNMRSWLGGIKSIFSSSNNSSTNQPTVPSARGAAIGIPRSATLANVPSNTPAGFTSSSFASNSNSSTGQLSKPFQNSTSQRQSVGQAIPQVQEDPFEANLSEIGFGLGRLKDMAMKLGDEIGDQNDMLDRITDKSERAGDSIKHQNRQMQQLLKKG